MAATSLSADLHPVLTEYVIERLRKNKITSVYSFITISTDKLLNITNLSREHISLVKIDLNKRFAGRYCNGSTINPGAAVPMSTGVPTVDTLLQGGLHPGHVYEICGKSGAGKSILSMTIAANVALRYSGSVCIIDTKCDFSAQKTQLILNHRHSKLSEKELGHTMARIKVERIFSPERLVQTVEELAAGKHFDEQANLKLLIIDSLPALWYLFQDSKSSCEALGLLTKLICSLRKLAAQYCVGIVLVNLAVSVVDGLGRSGSESKRNVCSTGAYSALGRFWESAPGTRLLLQNESSNGSGSRSVQVWKSNYLRSGEKTFFRITDAGVC
ncbi:DNA repair protein RAD51 homolog 4 [Anopheles nili]|uniref:DNA repair protein RAD51 homolog 4 n=1 Tax=Anopheles nili TaxID=185578 RepID=UPI00237B5288|nr:DNA repair protein RAD51 homolog 4 [Anopheles nili]